jgi:hypothetical protein
MNLSDEFDEDEPSYLEFLILHATRYGLYGRVPQTGHSVRIGPSACDCALRRMANLEGSSDYAIWN